MTSSPMLIDGPYYEDLYVGQVFEAPGLTLTDGQAALHQAILGDRLRLSLDATLCAEVTGTDAPLAHPGLVWDVAIGQTTMATRRVIANLFYRGLVLRRAPRIGDTLRTVTEVVALRDNPPRDDRAPSGLAVLRIRTTDQEDRVVLDFHRCAMLPMEAEPARPGHADDLAAIAAELPALDVLASAVDGWDLDAYRARVPGPHGAGLAVGMVFEVSAGDTVSSAPELARLTLNIAAVHTDPNATGRGRRLVYGGHTIGVALAQVMRAVPNLVTVLGWYSCDHLAPVYEEDVLRSIVSIDAMSPLQTGAVIVDLHVETTAERLSDKPSAVLDWRVAVVFA